MNFFDHKDLGNHLLQLCPKVVKHPVYCSICFATKGQPHKTSQCTRKCSAEIISRRGRVLRASLTGQLFPGRFRLRTGATRSAFDRYDTRIPVGPNRVRTPPNLVSKILEPPNACEFHIHQRIKARQTQYEESEIIRTAHRNKFA